MELSMATDYATDTGDPEPFLRRISEAGFGRIQWIHHWRHDFIYTEPEVQHIAGLMQELGLSLYDIHAPAGAEKNWFSTVEYQRRAGVEIIKNRIDMCASLGGSVVVTHVPEMVPANIDNWRQLKRSLGDLEGFCAERAVRLAVENGPFDDFSGLNELFSEHSPGFLGLCYDSGHGNIGGAGLDHLESAKERLISLHLHDNDGREDQHRPLFTGTVDWERLARIIAESPYHDSLTLETDLGTSGLKDEDLFLESAYRHGLRLLAMIRTLRDARAVPAAAGRIERLTGAGLWAALLQRRPGLDPSLA